MEQVIGEESQLKEEVLFSRTVAQTVISQLRLSPSLAQILDRSDAVLVFILELPFQLRVPPNPTLTLMGKDDSIVTLNFGYYMRPVYHGFGAIQDLPASVIRMLTPMSRTCIPSELSPLFDRCLESLNEFLRAYIVKTHDFEVRTLTLSMLPFGSLCNAYDISTFEEIYSGVFLLNPNVAYAKEPLGQDEYDEIAGFVAAQRSSPNPFALGVQLSRRAQQLWVAGEHSTAVILQAASVEVLLGALLRELMVLEGKSDADIARTIERPLMVRVRQEYHCRIGGKFSMTQAGPIRDWHNKVHLLRSRIVHGGYQPTRQEASDAIATGTQVVRYVWGLLKRKPKKFATILVYAS